MKTFLLVAALWAVSAVITGILQALFPEWREIILSYNDFLDGCVFGALVIAPHPRLKTPAAAS